MSSKEQKTEVVVAEEEVDAKKDVVVKGTKRPAEVKKSCFHLFCVQRCLCVFYDDRVLLAAIWPTPALPVCWSGAIFVGPPLYTWVICIKSVRFGRWTWLDFGFCWLLFIDGLFGGIASPVAVWRGEPACAAGTRRHVFPLRLLFIGW